MPPYTTSCCSPAKNVAVDMTHSATAVAAPAASHFPVPRPPLKAVVITRYVYHVSARLYQRKGKKQPRLCACTSVHLCGFRFCTEGVHRVALAGAQHAPAPIALVRAFLLHRHGLGNGGLEGALTRLARVIGEQGNLLERQLSDGLVHHSHCNRRLLRCWCHAQVD